MRQTEGGQPHALLTEQQTATHTESKRIRSLEAQVAALKRQLVGTSCKRQAMEDQLREARATAARDEVKAARELASKTRELEDRQKQLAANRSTIERLRADVRMYEEKCSTTDHFFGTVLSESRLQELPSERLSVIGSELIVALKRVTDSSSRRIPPEFICPITLCVQI